MKISARVHNGNGQHIAEVTTAGVRKDVAIPAKQGGPGSSVNGGELLFLALTTCYCNDVYREAARRGTAIDWIEVDVVGEFGGEGEPARHIEYSARVAGQAPEAELRDLLATTDDRAEIQNTLRKASRFGSGDSMSFGRNPAAEQAEAADEVRGG